MMKSSAMGPGIPARPAGVSLVLVRKHHRDARCPVVVRPADGFELDWFRFRLVVPDENAEKNRGRLPPGAAPRVAKHPDDVPDPPVRMLPGDAFRDDDTPPVNRRRECDPKENTCLLRYFGNVHE